MANKQIKDLTAVTEIADPDVFHVNLNATGADRKITKANLKTEFIDDNIATNAEAIAGASNTKIMSPAKTDLYIDERVATTPEAQDNTNDFNLLTPLKLKQYLDANTVGSLAEPQVISGGGALELYKFYIITDSLTYTLPNVAGFNGDEYLRINSIQGQEPIIQREGSNSEVLRLNDSVTDSSFIYDLNAEIIPIFNNTNNRWEI